MTNQNITLISYKEVLVKLQTHTQNHLLLGNGFNTSLNIYTNYKNIFNKMKKEYSGYENIDIQNISYDIEALISKMQDKVKEGNDKDFLCKYIEKKIKYDFMKATHSIVKENIKNVYQEEKSQGICLFFKNFTNYFTLNFDLSLYLLLMKFKKQDDGMNNAIAISNSELFRKDDVNTRLNHIYDKINVAYEHGTVKITANNTLTAKNLNDLKKAEFESIIKTHFESEGWKGKDIKSVCDRISNENKPDKVLTVNDSFLDENFKHQTPNMQNLFFLHGAFHIYSNNTGIRKITKKQDNALYEKLENIINDDYNEILCVLKGTSEEKKSAITDNQYLNICFEKLGTLDGSLVVFGSSLDDNDDHIFEKINESAITTIYISSCDGKKDDDMIKAKSKFFGKNIMLFDYNTVSYSID